MNRFFDCTRFFSTRPGCVMMDKLDGFTPNSVCELFEFSRKNLLNETKFEGNDVHYNSDFPVNNSYFRLFEDYYHGYITNLDLDE